MNCFVSYFVQPGLPGPLGTPPIEGSAWSLEATVAVGTLQPATSKDVACNGPLLHGTGLLILECEY